MSVKLSHESCVRTLSVGSKCNKCEAVCGYDAIGFLSNITKIDANACTECAACVAECPTGALTLHEADVVSLSIEELFCAAVKTDERIPIYVRPELKELCAKRVDEANALLAAVGFDQKIDLIVEEEEKDELQSSSRRALFRMFTKEGISAAHDSVKSKEDYISCVDYGLLKSKKLPRKRESFLESFTRLEQSAESVSLALSFASDKHIDESCNNCSLCYNLCPSGALETTAMKNAILFSPHLCLKCKLCEDICETNSISSLPMFDVSYFARRPKKTLKKFAAKLCQTCGAVFAAEGEECPRCAKESEDAMELLGL